MNRILFVSIAFPPKSDPESLQVAKFAKYISNDFNLTVVTSRNPTLYMEVDPALKHYSSGIQRIHHIKLWENKFLNYLIRKIWPTLLQLPDSKFSFYLSKPNVEKPDLIYSRSYPPSSTLLALKLKKKWPDVPWVLHLSDPWALSFHGDSPATKFSRLARWFNRRKEEEAFKMADQISFTSEKTIELYLKSYSSYHSKIVLTPNVFDDDTLNSTELSFDAGLKIVYTGGFGEKRSPLFFLETVRDWLAETPETNGKIQFIFSGPMTRENKEIFKSLEINAIVHLGMIGYDKMIRLQRSAHILVNIDTDIPDPSHAVFFPSKLLEYMAAKRRILTVSNSFSTTAQVIKQGFGDIVKFNDKQHLKELLSEYWTSYKTENKNHFEVSENLYKYSAQYNSKILSQRFRELIAKSKN